ncbi:unnamed protein product [Caenorhabditis auriculariae]|uniref:GPI transamidase subunit PIG-U n=1 Tax=Caenorhabditis auriculariae TaxID=2777116 RepID=A0A8S1GQ03_9PELO|nr:unnamed protein product [Caenorhabditis auriculariae]
MKRKAAKANKDPESEKDPHLRESLNDVRFAVFAILLRFLFSSYLYDWARERVELVTPVFSYEQLLDDLEMKKDGLPLYTFPHFHNAPMMMWIYSSVSYFGKHSVLAFSCLLDVSVAWLLKWTADAVKSKKEGEAAGCGRWLFRTYLFNPITIASCAICSLSTLYNFLAALSAYLFFSGCLMGYVVVLGIWTSWTVYPAILFNILFVLDLPKRQLGIYLGVGLAVVTAISSVHFWSQGSLEFLDSSYFYMLTFKDITPNVGLYWYFFVQVFDHFREFYVLTFMTFYWFVPVPLTMSIRGDPHLLFWLFLLLSSVFFPSPTLNTATVVFSLWPIFLKRYGEYWRYTLLIVATIVTCVTLMPVMWHMWMVSSSGNANFYFGVTLTYNIAMIYMVIDGTFVYFRDQTNDYFKDWKSRHMGFAYAFH